MLWLVVTAAGIGILLGLRLQVASIIAASAVMALTSIVLMGFNGASLSEALAQTGALLLALQGGYLIGLVLFLSWSRGVYRRSPMIGMTPHGHRPQGMGPRD